eukprot:TRINITY_DN38231_c0_g1_i1.p1 TRINITY_DN38231_c0_g1~~TRINITY_DN38231_c0_g1_i1.p1  ORF type:complete len:632 (+),score=152.82 TRINITY_DN38231_c0_g1_i1:76-1896(+)
MGDSDDELWAALEEQGDEEPAAPPPPPEEAIEPAPPPPPDDAVPPPAPPPDAPPPDAPPPPKNECEGCKMPLPESSSSSSSGLCVPCRFKHSNPFLPAKKLLGWSTLKVGSPNIINVPLAGHIDMRSGRLFAGHVLEARCLRVDTHEWRFDLGHSWPAGISLFVEEQRVLVKKPDEEKFEAPGPFDLTKLVFRPPLQVNQPLSVRAAISASKTEIWAIGFVLCLPVTGDEQIAQQVIKQQAPQEARMQLDLERIRLWVTAHRPDRVSKKDTMRCVEPPVMKLVCCTSLMRIERAVRGVECDHLQCFDLSSYIHTMRNIPPKHAWCCPVCDKPAPVHQLRLDAFAQSVLDNTADNVTEVLVADNGKFEVSATEDVPEDSSDEEALAAERAAATVPPQRQLTAAELQQAAMNLGRAFSAPAKPAAPTPAPPQPKPEPPKPRERSRSPKRGGQASPPQEEPVDKMKAWKVLQGLEKPEQRPPPPKVEEKRIGWLPDGTECSMCSKSVVEQGGVYCGRRRSEDDCGGCFQAICWKCMNKHRDKIGQIKTTKKEFASLGPDAWWMHERCMTAEDKRAYFNEDEEEEEEEKPKPKPKKKRKGEDDGDKFAWE